MNPIRTNNSFFGGTQRIYRFLNGYGASVIDQPLCSGGTATALYELAVIKWHYGQFSITYATPITNDVIQYCTEARIQKLLFKISKLKPLQKRIARPRQARGRVGEGALDSYTKTGDNHV